MGWLAWRSVYLAKLVTPPPPPLPSRRCRQRRPQAAPHLALASPRLTRIRAWGAEQVSVRNQLMVAFDWVKTSLFGRDLTRF